MEISAVAIGVSKTVTKRRIVISLMKFFCVRKFIKIVGG